MTRKDSQRTAANFRRAAINKKWADFELKIHGKLLHQDPHKFAAECLRILEAAGFTSFSGVYVRAMPLKDTAEEIQVSVPVLFLADVAAFLATMPGRRRGRPRSSLADEEVKLATELKSVRAAAKVVAAQTGKSEEAARSSIRSAKKRLKNSG